MNKYKVKEGRAIEHGGVRYEGGSEIELDAALALHHAVNIELVVEEKPTDAKALSEATSDKASSTTSRKKEEKVDATGGS